MGQVDKWRFERRNAYIIYSIFAKSPADIQTVLPLPYDYELNKFNVADNDEIAKAVEWYNSVSSNWN